MTTVMTASADAPTDTSLVGFSDGGYSWGVGTSGWKSSGPDDSGYYTFTRVDSFSCQTPSGCSLVCPATLTFTVGAGAVSLVETDFASTGQTMIDGDADTLTTTCDTYTWVAS